MKRLLLLALLFGLAVAGPGYAALVANPTFPQQPQLALVQFLQGTDTAGTYKTLYTGATNGSKVTGLWMNTNDGTATHVVTCQLKRSTVLYGGVAVTTVLSAGFANATPPQNLMSPVVWPGLPIDANNNPYFFLNLNDLIQCTFATALTASTVINVQAVVGDF